MLIDFGAARQATAQRTQGMTSVLTPGFAPIEQYSRKSRQGPFTDIYGLGALAYWALSGKVPDDATDRVQRDELRPVSAVSPGRLSEELASAVDAALAVHLEDRPQSVAEWRRRWETRPAPDPPQPVPDPPPPLPPPPARPAWPYVAAAAGVGVVALLVVLSLPPSGPAPAGVPAGGSAEPGSETGTGAADDLPPPDPEPDPVPDPPPDPGPDPVPDPPPSDPEADPPSAAEVEAGLGLDGASWRLIQLGLASSGFEPGLVDGVSGGATRAALRGWQASRGEKATGYLDAVAAAALLAVGRDPRAGTVFRECVTCSELVVVPAGTFLMGSAPGDREGRGNEGPQHRVSVARIALGVHEVTRDEYAAFVAATDRTSDSPCYAFEEGPVYSPREEATWRSPGYPQAGDHPVTCVSWEDARAYARWLGAETGARYRLPSEAEWEHAARGGTATRRPWGDAAAGQCGYANGADRTAPERFEGLPVADCTDGMVRTSPVGAFAANAFGLRDMLGNVWEWVEDCWHEGYEGAPGDGSAWTSDGDCSRRVLRGGSWLSRPVILRSGTRRGIAAGTRYDSFGFRVARTLD